MNYPKCFVPKCKDCPYKESCRDFKIAYPWDVIFFTSFPKENAVANVSDDIEPYKKRET
jgi:hypothetical protein